MEILLALRAAAGSTRRFSDLRRARGTDERAVARIAADLSNARLARIDDGLSYAPATAELRDAVDALATVYELRPLALVRAIESRPRDAVQRFADAFRVRRTV